MENERRVGESKLEWLVRVGLATEQQKQQNATLRQMERSGTVVTNPRRQRKGKAQSAR